MRWRRLRTIGEGQLLLALRCHDAGEIADLGQDM
jgi:hypothetical protein